MKDSHCVTFLQWALPRLQMRWPGFRKVRKQVCKRIERRRKALNLPDVAAYKVYLEKQPEEWPRLDSFCRISISRFYRDRAVFDHLRREVWPTLARTILKQGETECRCWSIGCASGEEPYTLSLIWHLTLKADFPTLTCPILVTEANAHMLHRAKTGCYPTSSLKDLPPTWRETAFTPAGDTYRLNEPFRAGLTFQQQDIRTDCPPASFHLILCRNLIFTYFEESLQQCLLTKITDRLQPGGVFVIGNTEQLPPGESNLMPWLPQYGIYQRR